MVSRRFFVSPLVKCCRICSAVVQCAGLFPVNKKTPCKGEKLWTSRSRLSIIDERERERERRRKSGRPSVFGFVSSLMFFCGWDRYLNDPHHDELCVSPSQVVLSSPFLKKMGIIPPREDRVNDATETESVAHHHNG